MRRTVPFRVVASAIVAVAVTLLAWGGLSAGIFRGTQLRFADALFPAIGPHPQIVVVEFGEDDLDALGRWPLDRRIHGELIDRLSETGAALIGYDVTFSEPSTDPAEDEALAGAVERAGNVVLSSAATFEGELGRVPRASALAEPIEPLQGPAAAAGHTNVIPDPDGIVRTLPPVIEGPDGELIPSFSLSILRILEEASAPITLRPDGVQVDGRLVPTGRGTLLDINFTEGYPEYSAVDVLEGLVGEDELGGRVVLVGATAFGLGDTRLTPLDKGTGESGVLVHANALNTMVQGAFLSEDGTATTLPAVFLAALTAALLAAFTRIWFSPLAVLGLLTLFLFVVFRRFDGGTVTNIVYPGLALVVSFVAAVAIRYFTEERERRRVTQVFSRYVAKDVVEEVLASPEVALATLEGASRPLSVLFADLRGFTAASENASPEQVVEALNIYLDAMTRAVNEEGGTVDKFMGDCVMAFWGAPRPVSDHAKRAAAAAMKMLDYIDEAVGDPEKSTLDVKGCGVGIATGGAVVGNIGSLERLDYTVIGDTVNTGSRLCDVAGPGEIMVTEASAAELDEEFRVAEMPPLQVKGKAADLRVFQILRPGQEPRGFDEAEEEAAGKKGAFQAERAAGYAPVEPTEET